MEEIMNSINTDEVTLEDCLTLYEKKDICTVIDNGTITDFVEN